MHWAFGVKTDMEQIVVYDQMTQVWNGICHAILTILVEAKCLRQADDIVRAEYSVPSLSKQSHCSL